MKAVVFGGAGLLGRAIAAEMRSRGHRVLTAGRRGCDIAVDFQHDIAPDALAPVVAGADLVINAVGILMERSGNSFERVHVAAPTALFAACAHARVARIVHISGLGVGTGIAGGYMHSKLRAEEALAAGPVDYAIVRPALLVDPQCPSTRLFQWLARLPVIALPGFWQPGAAKLCPIQVRDVATVVANLCEHPKALRRVVELAGPEVMSYRDMLQRYRRHAGLGKALWLPLPWWVMYLNAALARFLPQNVFSVDTMRMLHAQSMANPNEASAWLGRAPSVAS